MYPSSSMAMFNPWHEPWFMKSWLVLCCRILKISWFSFNKPPPFRVCPTNRLVVIICPNDHIFEFIKKKSFWVKQVIIWLSLGSTLRRISRTAKRKIVCSRTVKCQQRQNKSTLCRRSPQQCHIWTPQGSRQTKLARFPKATSPSFQPTT